MLLLMLQLFITSIWANPFFSDWRQTAPVKDSDPFPITQIEGVSYPIINDMVQDRLGYLWLATQDGLNRYNGYEFDIFRHDPQDPHSISANWINQLAIDAEGNLWVATSNGLDSFDFKTERFTSFQFELGLDGNRHETGIEAIYPRTDGKLNLLVASTPVVFDPRTGQYDHQSLFPIFGQDFGYVWRTFAGQGQSFWVSIPTAIVSVDADLAVARTFNPRELAQAPQARLENFNFFGPTTPWFYSDEGLYLLDPVSEGVFHLPSTAFQGDPAQPFKVNALTIDPEGRLWIGTNRGLYFLPCDSQTPRLVQLSNSRGDEEVSQEISCLFIDRVNQLWAGSRRLGLIKLAIESPALKQVIGSPLRSADIKAFVEDGEGRLWVGHATGIDVLKKNGNHWARSGLDWLENSPLRGARIFNY